jgi:hypothetical protein
MYLVLGEPIKPLFEHFRRACAEKNETVAWVIDLDSQVQFEWSFDSLGSSWSLEAAGSARVRSHDIRGVLVQGPPRLDPNSAAEPLEHSQMERNAMLFAWFWSLPCPVINRYSAVHWFAPRVPFSFWKEVIVKCGLHRADAILSNVESALQAFASDHGGSICYSPFSDFRTYPVGSRQDWDGLNKMATICPVNLVSVNTPIYNACVVGREVFWTLPAPGRCIDTEDRLKRLAVLAGLDFLEARLTMDQANVRVLSVEAFPDLESFNQESVERIAEALTKLLRSNETLVPPISMRPGL